MNSIINIFLIMLYLGFGGYILGSVANDEFKECGVVAKPNNTQMFTAALWPMIIGHYIAIDEETKEYILEQNELNRCGEDDE